MSCGPGGPDGAPDRITGPALGFCLLVTQRRHLTDAGIDIQGAAAAEWMAIAQAFASPGGLRPRPVPRHQAASHGAGPGYEVIMARRPIRVANCSGFYGDRLAAAREMLACLVYVLTGGYLGVERYERPNLRALNVVVAGLLAPGVAATTRPDAQAKGLGEYLRSRTVLVHGELR